MGCLGSKASITNELKMYTKFPSINTHKLVFGVDEKHALREICVKIYNFPIEIISIIESFIIEDIYNYRKYKNIPIIIDRNYPNDLFESTKLWKNNSYFMKVLFLGLGAVGKSSIIIKYIANEFMYNNWDPTIEDSYAKEHKMIFNNKEHIEKLDILDTAGKTLVQRFLY